MIAVCDIQGQLHPTPNPASLEAQSLLFELTLRTSETLIYRCNCLTQFIILTIKIKYWINSCGKIPSYYKVEVEVSKTKPSCQHKRHDSLSCVKKMRSQIADKK